MKELWNSQEGPLSGRAVALQEQAVMIKAEEQHMQRPRTPSTLYCLVWEDVWALQNILKKSPSVQRKLPTVFLSHSRTTASCGHPWLSSKPTPHPQSTPLLQHRFQGQKLQGKSWFSKHPH